MIGLTPKQSDLLRMLTDYIRQHGFSPTYEEIRQHIGLKSKSGVSRLIAALEKRGAIKRVPGMARAIELVPVQPKASNLHLFSTTALQAELDRRGAP